MAKKRTYKPRIVGGHVMTQADLERTHKYLLDLERVEAISDEMRAVVEGYGPSWSTSCRRWSSGGKCDYLPLPQGAVTRQHQHV